jgi:hypothetical protein
MPSQVAAEEDCRDLGIGSAGQVDLNDTRCKRTGIDCSSFYHDRQFQPLRAAALIEAFLEDPGMSRFRDGERYFFGRPIPR